MATLNKLHRYSTSAHFVGHHVDKILKYAEALTFLERIGYDIGNLLENLGNCYFLMGEMEKSIKHLKSSVKDANDKIHA